MPDGTYTFVAPKWREQYRDLEYAVDDLLKMAATIAGGGFDRARPLWEFTLVEGLRDGQNLFLDAQARWTGRYVPAFLRRYPFVFAAASDGQSLTLCIDEAHEGVDHARYQLYSLLHKKRLANGVAAGLYNSSLDAAAARRVGDVAGARVIARPHPDLGRILPVDLVAEE